MGHFDTDFIASHVEYGDGTPDHVQGTGEHIQHFVERFFQIEMLAEYFADFVEERDLLNAFHGVTVSFVFCGNGIPRVVP
jgi:hypothetical protein